MLDVEGLLLDRQRSRGVVSGSGGLTVGDYTYWRRPHVDAFVDALLSACDVGAWSPLSEVELDVALDVAFGDRRFDLLFEVSDAVPLGLSQPDGRVLIVSPSAVEGEDEIAPQRWWHEVTDSELAEGGVIRSGVEQWLRILH